MTASPDQPLSLSLSWWKRASKWFWRVMIFFWGTLFLGLIINIIATLLTSPTGTSLSNLLFVHLMIFYPLPFFSVIGILVVLTIIVWLGSREDEVALPFIHEQQSRIGIINTLRKAYTDELSLSLQGVVRIELGLHERFDLTHPTRLVVWQAGKLERALPDGTTIVEVYDQAGHGLLILGEPGAGKSTMLYDLAQVLLTRSEQDDTLPLPVILNLSSWTTKQMPLQEWLAEELELRYLIPRALGQYWQQKGHWLMLLDGLDEVAAEKRSACIQAINAYHATKVIPMVVCSRQEEYLAESIKLILQSAVMVQPLTVEEVEMYLKNAGPPLAAVQTVVHTNTVLQKLLTTPLMLSVVSIAFKDKTIKDLPQVGSPEEQQRYIFASYLRRMLYEHKPFHYSTPIQLQRWLVWLAQQLQRFNQSLFFLEHLQADWLVTGWSRKLYAWLGIYLPGAIIGSIVSIIACDLAWGNGVDNPYFIDLFPLVVGALIGGLLATKQISPFTEQTIQKEQKEHIKLGKYFLNVGILILFGYGFFEFVLSLYNFDFSGNPIRGAFILTVSSLLLFVILLWLRLSHQAVSPFSRKPTEQRWRIWTYSYFRNYLAYALLIGIFLGLGVQLAAGAATVVVYGLTYGWIGLLLSLLFVNRSVTIQPAEILIWSGRSLRNSLLERNHVRNAFLAGSLTLIIFGFSGVIAALLIPPTLSAKESLISGLMLGVSVGLPSGIIYWSLIGFLHGISHDTFPDQKRTSPNQGMKRSFQNGLLLTFVIFGISLPICILCLEYDCDKRYTVSGVADRSSLWSVGRIITGLFCLLASLVAPLPPLAERSDALAPCTNAR